MKKLLLLLSLFCVGTVHAGFPPMQVTAKANNNALLFYVSKDVGKDTNDCSRFRPCKTIGAAITVANAVSAYYKQSIINVEPSTTSSGYNENVTLSQQGVTLQCNNPVQNSRSCLVGGSLTVNLTGVAGGGNFVAALNDTYVNGFVFSSGASTALTFSGTTFQRLIISNCYFQTSSATTASITNSGVNDVPSTVSVYDTTFENNSASVPTVNITNGRFWLFGTQSTIQNDNASGHSVDQAGASSFIANITTITGEINVTDNTANATLNLSTVSSGSNPCVVTPSSPSTGIITLAYWGCTSTNTNSVTGSGVVVPIGASSRLSSSGDIISTVTQAVVPGFPQGAQLIGAGAASATNALLVVKNGHIKSTQTTAPTATVSANAGTSATCTLSNATDHAGKINLTFGTASFSAGAQCTVNFNKAYATAPICTLSAANANAGADSGSNHQIYVTSTTAGVVVNYGAAQNSSGLATQWYYNCLETQ